MSKSPELGAHCSDYCFMTLFMNILSLFYLRSCIWVVCEKVGKVCSSRYHVQTSLCIHCWCCCCWLLEELVDEDEEAEAWEDDEEWLHPPGGRPRPRKLGWQFPRLRGHSPHLEDQSSWGWRGAPATIIIIHRSFIFKEMQLSFLLLNPSYPRFFRLITKYCIADGVLERKICKWSKFINCS